MGGKGSCREGWEFWLGQQGGGRRFSHPPTRIVRPPANGRFRHLEPCFIMAGSHYSAEAKGDKLGPYYSPGPYYSNGPLLFYGEHNPPTRIPYECTLPLFCCGNSYVGWPLLFYGEHNGWVGNSSSGRAPTLLWPRRKIKE